MIRSPMGRTLDAYARPTWCCQGKVVGLFFCFFRLILSNALYVLALDVVQVLGGS